ncbi:MAG: exosome complex exonuclease Rrp41 [Candidatus Micrarchaeota archaeon]|nr:exosome complex exonuclease Rrp41 [Candidatus Micrarchaeota archaeon]MDE1823720.1 exosome complex exonuclease Rrp41 [Candidatus Micrarchaeota archaeon]MDE1849194.1 exosome complex exonuclease Rrp41 [Candidatus Micrarchaeota archaeon]
MMAGGEKPVLIKDGKRLDGRGAEDLREIKIIPDYIKNADGSAYIEWGNNKIIAAVYGPQEALPKHVQDPQRAIIKCRYQMAPFSSLEEHGRTGPNRRAIEISKVTKEVFENAVLIDYFPGSEIDLYVEVLQGDGGTRAAGITVASVAMALSGIPMRDLPYSVSVGKVGESLILDLNKIEDNYSDADMPIAISPKSNDILLLQMDGNLTRDEVRQGIKMAQRAGEKIARMQREALKAPYERIAERYKK